MEQQKLVGGSITITTMGRRLYQMFQEGIPKWAIIPDNPRDVGNIFYQFLNTVGADDLDRFIDKNSQNATITVYYKDYNHETVVGSIDMARRFIETNPVEHLQFRLAGGLLGILAAVNEEVEWSYKWNLILVMVTVFVLSVLTYAVFMGLCGISSSVYQMFSFRFMSSLGMGGEWFFYGDRFCQRFNYWHDSRFQNSYSAGRLLLFISHGVIAEKISPGE